MGARMCAEMVEARRLVMDGTMTPRAAALHVGITPSAIYMSEWYKWWRNERDRLTKKTPKIEMPLWMSKS
jgi:hypothetical protein